MRTCGSERLSELLKATQLVADPECKSKSFCLQSLDSFYYIKVSVNYLVLPWDFPNS